MSNQSELYYNILEICVRNSKTTTGEIATKLCITESDSAFASLRNLEFVKIDYTGGNIIELTPQGFFAYLSINSQKQSNELAIKAIEQSTVATKYAKWAFWVSIISFIVSIVFSIWSKMNRLL